MHEHVGRLVGSALAVEEDLERAFEVAMSDSLALVFQVAYGVLRHRADAEDVTQDAFAKAYRKFRQLRDRHAFRAWMVRITFRLALNKQRDERRRLIRESLRAATEERQVSIDDLERKERAQQLWAAIDALPQKLRIVTVLAGIEEHDLREVAALLRLPEGTVKSRLFLARQRLKEQLQWTRTA